MPTALTVAGSDSGGGAGIQADLKTFSAIGVYGTTVITAVTAQNTMGVSAIQVIEPEMTRKQLEAVLADIGADAVKIGMLGSSENIEVVAGMLQYYQTGNNVLDPVLASTDGVPLLPEAALRILIERLLPVVDLVTPNLPEAGLLTGITVLNVEDMKQAAAKLHWMGARTVLIKGGHLPGAAIDVFYNGTDFTLLTAERIATVDAHGTGCTLSAAIAAYLAKGFELLTAIQKAKEFITMALSHSLRIGRGRGPVWQFF